MLKKWLLNWQRKNGIVPIDVGAGDAFKRGDTTFTYRFHPNPFKGAGIGQETDVADAINKVEAFGWRLHSRELEGTGLDRRWHLVFVRPTSS